MPRKSVSLLLTAMFSAPLSAFGLGLGDISLDSSLNEPLNATITIDAVQPGDLTNFKAAVASGETFSRYGLDRPDFLNSLRFEITVERGSPELKVTSTRPITEPFLTFLVEANWDSGRLLREYTVLLDPPVFNPQSVAPPVRAPQTAGSQLSSSAGFVPRPAPAPAPAPIRRPAVAPITGPSYGPVRRNETLWAIADRAREGTGLSINQMMIAIYNANPEAFLGNINLIKEGSTLALPGASQAAQVSRQDAFIQARDHNQRWRAGGTVARTPAPVVASTDAGDDERRLRLVAPEAGSNDAGLADLQQQLEEEQSRNSELSDEIEQLRGELAENERLFNLRNEELSQMQAQLGETATDDGAVDVSATEFEPVPSDSTDGEVDPDTQTAADPEAVAGATEPESTPPTTPEQEPTPAPTPVASTPAPAQAAPGLMSRVTGILSSIWPFLLGGLAVIGGLLFWRSRQDGESAEAETWEALSRDSAIPTTKTPAPAGGQIEVTEGEVSDADVEYFEDTGTFKPVDFREAESDAGLETAAEEADAQSPSVDFPFEDTLAGDDALKLDQSDPLAEADFHIAYGLYDQAADLVRAASQREPERRDLKLKLLEIFFVWGNKDSFVEAAEALRNEMGEQPDRDWDKVAIMGRQICPDEPMFSGAGGVSADVVDLQLDETGETPIDLSTDETVATDTTMDFNLDDAIDAAGDNEGGDNVIDFDFSGTTTTAADDEGDTIRERVEAATGDTEDTEELELAELGIDLDFSSDAIDEPMSSSQTLDTGATGQTEALDIEVGEDFDELFGGLDDETTTLQPDDTAQDADDDALDKPQSMSDFEAAQDQERDKLLDTSELKVEMEELLAGAVTSDEDDEDATDDDAALKPASEATGSFSAEIASLADDGAELDVDFALDDDDDATELMEGIDSDETRQDEAAGDFSTDVFGSDDDTVLATALSDVDKLGGESMSDNDFSEIFADEGDGTAVMKMEDQDFSGDEEATVLAQIPTGAEGHSDDEVTFEGLEDAADASADSADEAFADAVFGGAQDEQTPSDDATQESVSIDLDVGDPLFDDDSASGDNTTMKVAAQELALPDMDDGGPSEVGTKLDLARAYMEMGDPDGARGILQEVIEEGDDGQKQDARALLDALP